MTLEEGGPFWEGSGNLCFLLLQGRLVHMPMNTASRGLSVHSKRLLLSVCVSTRNALGLCSGGRRNVSAHDL